MDNLSTVLGLLEKQQVYIRDISSDERGFMVYTPEGNFLVSNHRELVTVYWHNHSARINIQTLLEKLA